MTLFGSVKIRVSDLDLTLRRKIVQQMKRVLITVYGRIKVTSEEFRDVYESVLQEDIAECVCKYYGMSESELNIQHNAEAWYDVYRKYYG